MTPSNRKSLVFIPLLFLLPLTFTLKIGGALGLPDEESSIYIIRYIILPIAGLLVGASIFLELIQGDHGKRLDSFEKFVENRGRFWLVVISVLLVLIFVSLHILRYHSLHLVYFDFGTYDNKIWKVFSAPWPKKFQGASTGHFQPILIVYSLLYSIGLSPLVLLVLQVLFVFSGVIPLYLLARKRLKRSYVAPIVLLFLFYPATQFNAGIDFHPDHIFIPVTLWALYFFDKGKYFYLIPLMLIDISLKEPLIISTALLFGYMFLKRRRVLFFAFFLLSLLLLYAVLYYIIPNASGWTSGNNIDKTAGLAYLNTPGGWYTGLIEIVKIKKFRFLFFLFLPFLFLPLLRPTEIFPAMPAIFIALLSSNVHHQNVASQYTASTVPFVFLALIGLFETLQRKFSSKIIYGLFAWMMVVTISLNIAHSPGPLAVAFWNKDWSRGYWHFSSYMKSRHEEILEKAIEMIPVNPLVRVVSHSRVYQERLAHRFFYKSFPEDLREADFILLDNKRGPYLYDNIDVAGVSYRRIVRDLKKGEDFSLIFDNDGVLLFKRRKNEL